MVRRCATSNFSPRERRSTWRRKLPFFWRRWVASGTKSNYYWLGLDVPNPNQLQSSMIIKSPTHQLQFSIFSHILWIIKWFPRWNGHSGPVCAGHLTLLAPSHGTSSSWWPPGLAVPRQAFKPRMLWYGGRHFRKIGINIIWVNYNISLTWKKAVLLLVALLLPPSNAQGAAIVSEGSTVVFKGSYPHDAAYNAPIRHWQWQVKLFDIYH